MKWFYWTGVAAIAMNGASTSIILLDAAGWFAALANATVYGVAFVAAVEWARAA